jgi:hypothetical protein
MTYQDLWKNEVTRGSIATAWTDMYNFGLLPRGGDRIITSQLAFRVNEIAKLGQHYMDLEAGNNPLDNLPARLVPVNGIPWYWLLGVSSSAGTPEIHTVTPFTTGTKPSISTFTEDSTGNVKFQALGNVGMILDESMELGQALHVNMGWMGMGNGKSTQTPTVHSDVYPSAVTTPFDRLLSTDAFKWGADASETAYDILGFTRRTTNNLSGLLGSDGYYTNISEDSPIRSNWTVVFKHGADVSNILTDFATPTQRSIITKVYKADSTKYVQYKCTNAYCYHIQEARVTGQPTRHVGLFMGEDIEVKVVDGVNKSFYGE